MGQTTAWRRILTATALFGVFACLAGAVMAETAIIAPSRDNTMFEDDTTASNGAGPYLFAGNTNFALRRRALIGFDIAGSVPAGVTITSVQLELNCSRVAPGGSPFDIRLHRATEDWGEGTSDSANPGGLGAPATPGDATWTDRIFPGTLWATPGGTFVPAPSASTSVSVTGPYAWASTPAMVADVQLWLDDPAQEFGWVILGDEVGMGTAKRFDTRENPDEALRPVLTVEYVLPSFCGDGVVDDDEECDEGPDNSDDPGATCRTDCTLAGCGDGIVDPDEECDEGDANGDFPGASCRTDCTPARCGDGIVDPGEECDRGPDNSDDPDAVCSTSCTYINPPPVPTVSQWGLLLMGLLLLSTGTIVFGRSLAASGRGTTGTLALAAGMPLFSPGLFLKALGVVMAVVFVGFAVSLWLFGGLTQVDRIGALICAPVAAYLAHLWIGMLRK